MKKDKYTQNSIDSILAIIWLKSQIIKQSSILHQSKD